MRRIPLVAENRYSEVISRKQYHSDQTGQNAALIEASRFLAKYPSGIIENTARRERAQLSRPCLATGEPAHHPNEVWMPDAQ
jgi:hypothetical protein